MALLSLLPVLSKSIATSTMTCWLMEMKALDGEAVLVRHERELGRLLLKVKMD